MYADIKIIWLEKNMTTRASKKFSGKYRKWKKEEMISAMQAVSKGKMGLNKAAKNFGVPKTTLRLHLQRFL